MNNAIVTVNTPFYLLKSMQTTEHTTKRRRNQMTKQTTKLIKRGFGNVTY